MRAMALVQKIMAGETTESGKFERQKNRFTTHFGKAEGQLPVEANRYRILWAPVWFISHRKRASMNRTIIPR